ncbi:hypothetical protein O3P69_010099 [Scylla paramamosain]|uniref:Uncharacterized protein n=1 Tax=Scylla paramamosain TaxID=85552 RepID=A0AAW0SQ80_SCYPA
MRCKVVCGKCIREDLHHHQRAAGGFSVNLATVGRGCVYHCGAPVVTWIPWVLNKCDSLTRDETHRKSTSYQQG